MVKIEVVPLKGICIDRIGQIYLRDSKETVESLLGPPSQHFDDLYYYQKYEVRIQVDKNDHVKFIEFFHGPYSEKIKLSLYDIDPFQIGAEKLLEILHKKNNGAVDDSEADYGYSFLNISVGVWRQMTERDVQEKIADRKRNGKFEEFKKSLEAELAKVKNFWTIGIGVAGYYS